MSKDARANTEPTSTERRGLRPPSVVGPEPIYSPADASGPLLKSAQELVEMGKSILVQLRES